MRDSKRPVSLNSTHVVVTFIVGVFSGIVLGPRLSDIMDQPFLGAQPPFAGRCTRIIDADSIVVTTSHHGDFVVHLVSVAAPNQGKRFFLQALKLTTSFLNQDVTVDPTYGNRGEVRAWVFSGPRCLNNDLVKAGYARYAGGDLRDAPTKVSEDEARKARRGLWSDPKSKELE